MEIKKVWAMYFSPTGGTEKAVRTVSAHVAESLGVPVEIYDFTLPDVRKKEIAFTETDLVFFGTPVIAGRVPNVLLPYLKTVVGGKAYTVPMVSFGNRNFDDALIELRNILEDDGFRTIAGGAFVSEHSFSRKLSAGRPDEEDYKVMHEFAEKIVEKINSGWEYDGPAYVKGEDPIRPYFTPRDRYGNAIDIRKAVAAVFAQKFVPCAPLTKWISPAQASASNAAHVSRNALPAQNTSTTPATSITKKNWKNCMKADLCPNILYKKIAF